MAGISKNTFWNWLQSHGLTQKRDCSPSKSNGHSPVRFVEVAAQTAHASALLVRLPGGATVVVADERQVVLVARLVQSLACSSSC
jgi:hypothetical protein